MKTIKHFLVLFLLGLVSTAWALDGQLSMSGGGNGTVGTPYKIANSTDLRTFSTAIAAGTDLSAYVELASSFTYDNSPAFTGIGTGTNYFKGSFDGRQFSITGLSSSANYTGATVFGFFNYLGNSTTTVVKNLTLSSINYSLSNTANTSCGGLVGNIVGATAIVTIDNCYIQGSISVSGTQTTATTIRVGGIVANNSASGATLNITNCSSNVGITATNNTTGSTTARTINCGGILGDNLGGGIFSIVNCFTRNSISATSLGTVCCGGILGNNTSTTTATKIYNCYSNMTIDALNELNITPVASWAYTAGICGNAQTNASAEIKNCIALNTHTSSKSGHTTLSTPLKLGRIIAGTINTLASNSAYTSIDLKQYNIWSGTVTGGSGTLVSYTISSNASGKDGATMATAGSNWTQAYSDAKDLLHTGLSTYSPFNSITLKDWSVTGTSSNVPAFANTITFGTASYTKNSGDPSFTQTATPTVSNGAITYISSAPSVASVDNSTGAITIGVAGNATITATQAAAGSYAGATATYSITVNSSLTAPTISFPNSNAGVSKNYGDANFTNTATSNSGGAITYSSGTPSIATVNASTGAVTILSTGTTIITANQAASGGYDIGAASYTLTVNGIAPTISFSSASISKGSNEAAFTQTASSNSGGTITYSSGTPAVATVNSSTGLVTIVGVGSTVITASQAASGNYNSGSTTYTLTVTLTSGGGDGTTSGTAYKIITNADLWTIRNSITGGSNLTSYIELANNITYDTNTPWTGIGTSGNYFKGSFDGKGYYISGINTSNAYSGAATFGFFNYVGNGSIIKNLELRNINYSISNTANTAVGGIAGSNPVAGTVIIDNCKVSGTMNVNGTQTTSTGTTVRVGGLAGSNGNGTNASVLNITNSTADINITTTNNQSSTGARTINCGGVLGDDLGSATLSIINCNSSGLISATSLGTVCTGGILGINSTTTAQATATKIYNCSSTMTIDVLNSLNDATKYAFAGGICGNQQANTSAEIKNCNALNAHLGARIAYTSSGHQYVGRICANTLNVAASNSASSTMELKSYYNWANDILTPTGATSVTYTAVSNATGNDGSDVTASTAFSNLNTYVTSNPTYNGVTLKQWPALSFTNSVENGTSGSPSGQTATSNTAGTLTYSSSNQAVATVNASSAAVSKVSIGSSVITAVQPAMTYNSTDYMSASVAYLLNFYTAAPTASFLTPSYTKSFGDAAFTQTLSSNSSGSVTYSSNNTAVATVNAASGSVAIVGVGSTTITATQAATADYSYSGATASYTVTVSAATPTVTPTVGTYTYNGTAQGPNAATNTGTGSSYTFSYVGTGATTYEASATMPTNAGTYTVTTTVAADGNYAQASSSATPFTIVSKVLTIGSASIASKPYDGSTTSGIVTAGTLSGFVGSETVTVNTAVGTYADANVGTGKSSTIVYTLADGTNGGTASNYSLANGSATGDITAITSTLSGNLGTQALLAGTDVTVDANTELTVDNSVNVHAITVAPMGKLTINDTKSLTVGNLIIQSSSSGTGTFVDANASGGLIVTGTSSVQQYVTAGRNWYISSPLSGASSNVFAPTVSNPLYFYDETQATSAQANAWNQITSATALSPTMGYITNMNATVLSNQGNVVTFTGGSLNTGTITTGQNGVPALTYTEGNYKKGFNLVGNPYLSYLDWDNVTKTNVMTSIWLRTKVSSTYIFDTYNALGQLGTSNSGIAVNNHIPPMQAFWVRATSTGVSLVFNNNLRSHKSTPDRIFNAPASKMQTQSVLKLQVSNGLTTDEAILYSNSSASNDFDGYDSPKMSNNSTAIPEIYTIAGQELVAINGLNSIPFDTEIPLGFTTATAGNFSIKASQISNFNAGTQITIKDNQAGIVSDLTDGSSYSFTSGVTTNNSSRFTLIFHAPSVATGINPAENSNVWISTNANNEILINANTIGDTSVTIYNAIGQKILSKNLTKANVQLGTSFAPGVYMVTVNNSGKTITKKVIID